MYSNTNSRDERLFTILFHSDKYRETFRTFQTHQIEYDEFIINSYYSQYNDIMMIFICFGEQKTIGNIFSNMDKIKLNPKVQLALFDVFFSYFLTMIYIEKTYYNTNYFIYRFDISKKAIINKVVSA